MNISLSIDDAVVQRLDTIAGSMNRSRSFAACEAIEHYLNYQEWFIKSVEAAIAQADAGGPFLTHEEVVARSEARLRGEL